MFGLDNSGKTLILYLLKFGTKVFTIPTIGYNIETIDKEIWEKSITIWDIGGKEKIRPLWYYYLSQINGKVKVRQVTGTY